MQACVVKGMPAYGIVKVDDYKDLDHRVDLVGP